MGFNSGFKELTTMFLSWSVRGWIAGGDGMKTSLNSYLRTKYQCAF